MGSTSEEVQQCEHLWIANSGRGGEPEFRPAQIVAGDTPVMHVVCSRCQVRTWFSEARWRRIPAQGESRQQRRKRERDANVAERKEQERHARMIRQRQAEYKRDGRTCWNGEPAECRKVRVIVGRSERRTWWCADLEGQERDAVEVTYADQVFYLDNADGNGWAKVTIGRGSPGYGHAELPVERVIARQS
jgi:hypothetical protein